MWDAGGKKGNPSSVVFVVTADLQKNRILERKEMR
jgi:hypothetical protein